MSVRGVFVAALIAAALAPGAGRAEDSASSAPVASSSVGGSSVDAPTLPSTMTGAGSPGSAPGAPENAPPPLLGSHIPVIPSTPGTDMAPETPFSDYQRGAYATALRDAMRRLSAFPNDAPTMTLIGQIYDEGLAVPINRAEAARWFQLAANLGDPQGEFSLGRAYLQGEGVEKDLAKAKLLFEKAADGGVAGAAYNLGVMAIQDKDFNAAAGWFSRAAGGGNTDADYALAELYRHGQGVAQNDAKAMDLMRKAADERNVDAQVEYAIALFNGEGTPKNEALAAKYFLAAAAEGNPVAQNRVARMLAAGRGVPKNMIEAMKWHVLARAAGLNDSWLDQQMATLSPQERASLEEALRRWAGG